MKDKEGIKIVRERVNEEDEEEAKEEERQKGKHEVEKNI